MVRKSLKKYFVPHEENDYRPHILQQAAVVGMLVLVLLTFTVANLQSRFWVTSDWLVSTVLPAVVVTETNEERVEQSLLPLRRSEVLDKAAEMKAKDMAEGEYFAHHGPRGQSPWYWFNQAGYDFVYAGENLAVHFTDSSEVVEAWMKSPTHKDNILNKNYREIGIGTARGRYEGFDTVFVVQLFGTPALVSEEETVAIAEDSAESTETEEVEEPSEGTVAGVSTEEDKEVSLTDEGTVVYSSFASTSKEAEGKEEQEQVRNLENVSGGGDTPQTPNMAESSRSSNLFSSLATKPQTVLQVSYLVISLLVLVALILSIAIEIRRQHPAQIAYGTSLIAVMLLLFYVHISVAGGIIIA